MSLLDWVRRTRQHHAIEHATIHLLAARHPNTPLAGLSDPWGFTLFGNVDEDAVRQAVSDALLRLQAGQSHLARHPNCGTNLTVAVFLATLAAGLGGLLRRPLRDRMVVTAGLMVAALFASQPLGMQAQRLTTLADVSDRWLVHIETLGCGRRTAYRVHLE